MAKAFYHTVDCIKYCYSVNTIGAKFSSTEQPNHQWRLERQYLYQRHPETDKEFWTEMFFEGVDQMVRSFSDTC
jgi:hypothetical protein